MAVALLALAGAVGWLAWEMRRGRREPEAPKQEGPREPEALDRRVPRRRRQ